ncbi:DUF805 domain-containing protein [Lentilactobacillus curieae]|uniref:DUF805 domain-containing protein n=1 Tax=Lentilactobacillus curieae TaxID=1138822 RepID=A0A1S6QGN5_9LACO|nr:DUF805 domain-containing protein [Lentilactobacillus curieae]AQW20773.1 DUF805 domain-containing protein [Lentilactobacillus curieae]
MQAYKEFWTKMFVFNAKATRKQYWISIIINAIVVGLVSLVTGDYKYVGTETTQAFTEHNYSLVFSIFLLLVWIAEFTIRARRLHDSGHSNWWILLYMIPLIGWIWLFILLVMPSKDDNRWPDNQSEV